MQNLRKEYSQKKVFTSHVFLPTTQRAKKPAIIAKRAPIPLVVKELAADEEEVVEAGLVSPELVAAPLEAVPPLAVPLAAVAPEEVTAPEEAAVPVPVVVA